MHDYDLGCVERDIVMLVGSVLLFCSLKLMCMTTVCVELRVTLLCLWEEFCFSFVPQS